MWSLPSPATVFIRPAADGVQALTMNSLRSAWTPFLAGPTDSLRQAKGETEARYSQPSVEIYSLADWYKIPVRSRPRNAAETCKRIAVGTGSLTVMRSE